MKFSPRIALSWFTLILISHAWADGPTDNSADRVRRLPPPGKPVPAEDKLALERGLQELSNELKGLSTHLAKRPALLSLLPDVEVFDKAVRWALDYDEIFNPTNEIPAAKELLRQGLERARLLRDGQTPWTTATGLVVRGYRSRLDGSVQPYGLVVPTSFRPGSAPPHRLDFWFHGRGETLSELNFIRERQRSAGEFTPRDTFVLHPYGRYCNGQKLAGEVDAFEALEHVQKNYPIDNERLVVRGFSLGGAACWHMAVHHASRWAAAAPGAGFSETPDFLKVFQNEMLKPSDYEQKLWHLYDCPDYAINLTHCPTVAYSGEVDKQKQAADIMAQALAKEGIDLIHIIGAKAGHQYTPEARSEINRRIDSIAARGRDPLPKQVRFATYTLRYREMAWVRLDTLEKHWEEARVDVALLNDGAIGGTTKNIQALSFVVPPGYYPFDVTRPAKVTLDGEDLTGPRPGSDRSWIASLRKSGGRWKTVDPGSTAPGLSKRHGLQGPIDDAFCDSFLMVQPTTPGWHASTHAWASQEMAHAIEHWRRQFRGHARVKSAAEVSDADIAAHNLILWGDPASNPVLARILPSLPLRWTSDSLEIKGQTFKSSQHQAVIIYPNPLNSQRYIVLNSGFTFREYDYLNNARQIPKLPDYAIVDIQQPVTPRSPGGIAFAGFFDESWQ